MEERAGDETLKADLAPETTPAKPAPRPFRVQTLVALVACAGALFWAYRTAKDGMRPSIGWTKMLRSGDIDDRQIAARQLGDSTLVDFDVAIPALVSAMGDKDERVRAATALALGTAGLTAMKAKNGRPEPKEVAQVLVRALGDPGPEVRISAATALGDFAVLLKDEETTYPIEPSSAASGLATLLSDPSIMVRTRGENALVRIGSGSTIDPPSLLLEGLKSWPLKESRAMAASVLGSYKGGVGPTVSALTEALKDKEPEVRSNAAVALQKLGPDAAPSIPSLVANLSDSFVPPPPPPPRFPGIVGMPSPGGGGGGGGGDESTDPAVQAARAIGKIVKAQVDQGGTPLSDVVSALIQALKSDRAVLKDAAEDALRQIGKGASAAIPALMENLAESCPKEEPGYGANAATALGDLAPGTDRAADVIQALTSALGAKEADTRRTAARALLKFGPAALAALPRLRELDNDPDRQVKLAAKAAGDRIEGKPDAPSTPRKGQGRRGGGVSPQR